MQKTDVSLDELLNQQAAIEAAIKAKRESIKDALKQEAAAFVEKIEKGIEGSSYDAVQFIANAVGVKLSVPTKAATASAKKSQGRRSSLNEDQKTKIAELYAQEMSVADISRRIFTDPQNADYQRINGYIKANLKK